MRHRHIYVTILMNILFCAALLWFFSRNAFLRPYLGSSAKEFLSGLLLLATLYANYFVFYPKLRKGHTIAYWLSVVVTSLVAGCIELAIGYSFISEHFAAIITKLGPFDYFSNHLFLVFSRNLAFNFFPYLLGEKKQLQQSLETEVRVVYKYARMIDVRDSSNNCQHISIDDIFYCKKNENETDIYTVDGVKYTRYCPLKYLIQLLENKDFTRISPSIVVPFQHIASCDGKAVVMKKMSWTETPLTFNLDTKRHPQASALIEEYLRTVQKDANNLQADDKKEKCKKPTSVPPKEKIDTVLDYINKHPGCRSTGIISQTSYSKTTLDRCLSDLKKQGLVEYIGSKKSGGYRVVSTPQDNETAEATPEVIAEEKAAEPPRICE